MYAQFEVRQKNLKVARLTLVSHFLCIVFFYPLYNSLNFNFHLQSLVGSEEVVSTSQCHRCKGRGEPCRPVLYVRKNVMQKLTIQLLRKAMEMYKIARMSLLEIFFNTRETAFQLTVVERRVG